MKIELLVKYLKKKSDKKLAVIKDFTYITLKKRGKPMLSNKDIMSQLYRWIKINIPDIDLKRDLLNANPDDLIV